MHFFKRIFPAKSKRYLPIALIILSAIFLRLYLLPTRTIFDADQEEIAFRAREILSGNVVLLGQKTSLGSFCIGPGFIYLWALFALFFSGNPISGAYLSVGLGTLFILGIYLTARKIFSEKVGLFLAFFLSISVVLIAWDQQPWAPSLFYLSELMVFYGLYISSKNKYGIPLASLGIGLGFQSHFAVFLLLFPVLIYLMLFKPLLTRKNIAISLIIIILSILPVFVYDIVNGFVNFQRLISLFTLGVSGNAPSTIKIFTTLVSNSLNLISLHFTTSVKYLLFATIGLAIFWRMIIDKEKRTFLVLSLLMLFIPFLIFLFYKSNFSEYYLMTTAVPFVFIIGYLMHLIKSKLLIVFIMTIFAITNMYDIWHYQKPMNLSAKEKIVKKIIEKGGEDGYGVSLSTQLGYNFGYRYLFNYYGATPDIPPLKNQKRIFTIVVPPGFDGIKAIEEVDGVGLRWEGI